MEVLRGGDVYVYHARVVCQDMRFGVRLSIMAKVAALDSVREVLKKYYGAEKIFLSYESSVHER